MFFLKTAQNALAVAEAKAISLGVKVYCVIAVEIDPKTKEILCRGRWLNPAGSDPEWIGDYNIEAIALSKLGSTIHHGENTPPVTRLTGDLEYIGGVILEEFRIGVSGAEEGEDYLVAMEALEYMLRAVPTNHIGIRFATIEDFNLAKEVFLNLGWNGYQAPEPEHLDRWYFKIPGTMTDDCGLYLELQVFIHQISSVHIEVGSDDARELLNDLGNSERFTTEAPCGMARISKGFNIHVSPTNFITRTPGK